MEKEFAPYQPSFDLKELGFDEPCLATYNHDGKLSRNPSHNMEDLPIEGQPYFWQNSKIHISCISAPLYQQAFRWFREKYDLWSNFYPNNWYVIRKPVDENSGEEWSSKYTSYEESQLECLKRLIEIVNSQSSRS